MALAAWSSAQIRANTLDILLGFDWSFITYCHVDDGCKVALEKLVHVNGMARGKDGAIFAASTGSEQLYILDEQADNTLVIADILHPGEQRGVWQRPAAS